MPACKHERLNFVGEQKTDDGANVYYQCAACGTMLVFTPSRQVVGIPSVQTESASQQTTAKS